MFLRDSIFIAALPQGLWSHVSQNSAHASCLQITHPIVDFLHPFLVSLELSFFINFLSSCSVANSVIWTISADADPTRCPFWPMRIFLPSGCCMWGFLRCTYNHYDLYFLSKETQLADMTPSSTQVYCHKIVPSSPHESQVQSETRSIQHGTSLFPTFYPGRFC